MPKKFRVISQAETVAGKTKPDVHKALLKLNMKPEQIQLLLLKPLVIKKGLDNAAALELAERFSAAGLKVRIEAYEVAAPVDITSEDKQREQIYALLLKTFTNPVQPATLVEKDKLGLLGALISALPAPKVYASLIVIVGLVFLWYLGSGHALIFGGLALPPPVMTLLWVVTWLLPALAGMALLVFLLYPFWPRRRLEPSLTLDVKRHARFHHLINQLTAAMDVTAPEVIEITPGAAVQVVPVRGLLSLGRGDLRLSLGLAAVAGCSVQEFAGLLAKEFGRYASAPSARAAIWIRSINHWFADRARTPDEWDERLDLWVEAHPSKPVRWTAAFIGSQTRRVRRLLARLTEWNTRTTQPTLQRIEEDADQFQVRVAGSGGFRASALQLHTLAAAELDIRQLNHLALYQREQLLRDLPAAIVACAAAPTAEIQSAAAIALQANHRLWEGNAADAARIERAVEVPDPGMLACTLPAHLLFEDFAQLCDSATLNDYLRRGITDASQHRLDNARILSERATLMAQSRINGIQNGVRAPVNADGSVEWTGQA